MENPYRTRELGIPELIVVNDSSNHYIAKNRQELTTCNCCGYSHLSFIKFHDRHLIDILDASHTARIIDLTHSHSHFKCSSNCCNKTNETKIKFAEPKSRVTCRLAVYIYKRRLVDSARHIEEKMEGRLTDTAIDGIVSKIMQKIDKTVPTYWEAPTVMGIHSAIIKGVHVWLVTNVEKETLIDVLPDVSVETLLKLSKRFKTKNVQRKIKTIWIDLDQTILFSVKEVFPHSEILIGKYQIKRFFTNVLLESLGDKKEKKRPTDTTFVKPNASLSRPTRKKLDMYLSNNPETKILYDLKEQIHKLSLPQIIDVLKEMLEKPPLQTHEDYLIQTILSVFYDQIVQSNGKAMFNENGDDITSTYHDTLDAIIDEHLSETRKCDFNIMRARILHSDPDLVECISPDLLMELPDNQNLITHYCTSLCTQFYHPRFKAKFYAPGETYRRMMTYGQPLNEVESRLRKVAEMYGVKKKQQTPDLDIIPEEN